MASSPPALDAPPCPGLFQITMKVFLLRQHELLVLRDRSTGEGDLPGGRLDEGELHGDWRLCVERELGEELGPELAWQLEPEPLFWFPHHVRSSGRDALGFAWQARYLGGAIHLSAEHDLWRWVPLDTWDPAGWFVGHQLEAVRRFQRRWRAAHEA